jgi:hypothetical protein
VITPRAVVAFSAIAAASVAVWWLVPPIAQDPAYHRMADERPMLGVPNALNVFSNAAFLLVGLMGLATVLTPRSGASTPVVSRWERWPYGALFAGTALTAFGSAYYHLAPGNARLVWDRLPMTLGFMGLLTAVIAERGSLRFAQRLFVPLLIVGAASVGYWYWSELRGAGDLRLYALVQFGSLLAILVLVLWTGGRDIDARYLMAGLAVYAVSKVFEWADAPIFALGGVVSGHTLKHLAAAIAVGCVVVMVGNQESGIRNRPRDI